jgi:hypothetical protein
MYIVERIDFKIHVSRHEGHKYQISRLKKNVFLVCYLLKLVETILEMLTRFNSFPVIHSIRQN